MWRALLGEGSDELFAGYPHYRLFRAPFSFLPKSVQRDTALDVMCLMPKGRTVHKLMTSEIFNKDALDAAQQRVRPWFEAGDAANDMLRFEAETALVANQLMRVDKLTMAHSVEARVPFLDKKFAEYANAIPFGIKTENRVSKAIFRTAMQSRLPRTCSIVRNRARRGHKPFCRCRELLAIRWALLIWSNQIDQGARLVRPKTDARLIDIAVR